MAPKEASRTFDAPRDAVCSAIERAMQRVGMRMKSADPERAVFTATTGVSIWSWGERVEMWLATLTPMSTAVTVQIALKFQLFGWGQQRRVADGLLDEIGRQLAAPAPPPPSSQPPPPPPR